MARNKQVGVRLSVQDEGARRAFRDFGTEGDRALAKIAQEGREANAVLRQINASAQATRSVFDGLTRLKGGIAGLVTGFVGNAVVQQVRDVARGVAEVGDAAKRAGLDLAAFQELKFVAEQNRIGVDQLVDGIKELNLRADEFITTGGGSAAEAFQRLGYNAERLREKLKDPSALFSEIIGKLQLLDRAAQIRVLDEIFGGSAGEQFVQLIEQGEQGLRDTIAAAHDLGVVLDEDMVRKADELDRKFSEIATTVDQGLKRVIVEAADLLSNFIDQFNEIENRATGTLETRLESLGREIVDLDRKALEADRDARAMPMNAGLYRGQAALIRQQIAERRAEEANILAILDQRGGGRSAPPPPQMDLPGSLPGWDDFTSTFKPPKSSTGSSRGSATTEAERQQEKIRDVVQALQDELAALNMTATEREVMNQLRRAGVDAASSEGQTIRGLVEQLSREEDAIERVESAMENLGGTAKDVLGTIISGLREGKEAAEIFADVTDQLVTKLLSNGIDMGVNALTGLLGNMLNPGAGLTGGSFGNGLWGSAIFGQAHSGWQVGRGNPPQTRHLSSLPRMHMGGLNREEQLIVARRDESIFTPRQMDNAEGLVQALARNAQMARQQSGGDMIVEVHNHSGEAVRQEQSTRADGAEVRRIIIGEVGGALAAGKFDTVLEGSYGLKRKGYI